MQDIREEYETTKTSFNKLSEKYNIHSKQIERQAKKEGWIKYKPTTNKSYQKTLSDAQKKRLSELTIYLNSIARTERDKLKVELYLISYENLISIKNSIDTEDFLSNETKLLKQLQAEQKNLNLLIEDIEVIEKMTAIEGMDKGKREDYLETEIVKKAIAGDKSMMLFYAKTQMKNKGYNERHELDFENVPPLKVEFTGHKLNRDEIEAQNEAYQTDEEKELRKRLRIMTDKRVKEAKKEREGKDGEN